MKNLFIILLLLGVISVGSAQEEVSKWSFGVTAGLNNARLTKGGSLFKKPGTVKVSGSRLGFQGMLVANYTLDKRGQFSTGLGLTRVQHTTNRTREVLDLSPTFLLDEYTYYDYVQQDLLLLTVPVSVRYFFVPLDLGNPNSSNFFMELGFHLQLPLTDDSRYSRLKVMTGTTHTLPQSPDDFAWDLSLRSTSPFVKAGVVVGGRVLISYGWEFLFSKSDGNNDTKYTTKMQSISMGYFFAR
jgi:hypothetical protein